jgi:Mn2+/Fe2+ NRAMP family transporter
MTRPAAKPGPVTFTLFWTVAIAFCIAALYGAAIGLIWLIDNQPLLLACICAVAFYAWFVRGAARREVS